MAVTFNTSSASNTGAATATSLSLTLPTWTVRGGDWIVLILGSGAGSSAPTADPTASGYALQAIRRNTNGATVAMYTKRAVAGDSASSVSVTYAAAQLITLEAHVYSGVGGVGINVTNPTTDSAAASATTGVLSALTPTQGSGILVGAIVGRGGSSLPVITMTTPTSWVNTVTSSTAIVAGNNVSTNVWNLTGYGTGSSAGNSTFGATQFFSSLVLELLPLAPVAQSVRRLRFPFPVRRRKTSQPPTPGLRPAPPATSRGRHQVPPVVRRQRGSNVLPAPVAAQVAPALPPQPRRRSLGQFIRPARRSSQTVYPAASATPTAQALPAQPARRASRPVFARRRTAMAPVPSAVLSLPTVSRGRHQAPTVPRRRTSTTPVPTTAPVVTTTPPSVSRGRHQAPPVPRRRPQVGPVPAGTPAVTAQALPPQQGRRGNGLLGWVRPARRATQQVFPAQAATPTTQALPPQPARRSRFVVTLRRRTSTTPAPTTASVVIAVPPSVSRGRHQAPPTQRRRLVPFVPTSTTSPVPQQPSRRRVVITRRRVGSVSFPWPLVVQVGPYGGSAGGGAPSVAAVAASPPAVESALSAKPATPSTSSTPPAAPTTGSTPPAAPGTTGNNPTTPRITGG